MSAAPYPADTRAKGWRFELDYERVEQSSTWALAGPEARPWLLMLWMTAWRQVPCGSIPTDEEVIAALIGMPPKVWAKHRRVLLRGWAEADDGRMYHNTLVELVQRMLDARGVDRTRQDARQKQFVAIRERDGRACVYCGHTKYLTLDHLLPLSRGGDNDERNLAMACRPCNSKKGARTPEEAGMVVTNAAAAARWRNYMADRSATSAPGNLAASPNFSGGETPRNDTGTGTGTNTQKQAEVVSGTLTRAPGPPPDLQVGPPQVNPEPGVSPGAAACIAMRRAGLSPTGLNPSHPRLLALVAAGAGPAEFAGFVPKAQEQAPGREFTYILGCVEGERRRAANGAATLHRGPMPNRQEALEQRNKAVAARWLASEGVTTQ